MVFIPKPSDASVYSHEPMTHRGREVPVGTDMTQLGLDPKQLRQLMEGARGGRERPRVKTRARKN